MVLVKYNKMNPEKRRIKQKQKRKIANQIASRLSKKYKVRVPGGFLTPEWDERKGKIADRVKKREAVAKKKAEERRMEEEKRRKDDKNN